MHICVCQYILNCYHQTMHMHYTRVSMAKPNSVVLFLVIFFLANSMKEGFSIIECPEIEKEALLSFKHSVVDSSNRLSSWNTSNCCDWGGVVCSNVTGNVHQLHLKGFDIDGWYSILQGKINPSLLKLKHLKYLDLSNNEFAERIPSFMGSLTSLEYLDLSNNGFYGKIPPTIGNLSRLHTLSLEVNFVDVDSLEWLRGLSQLKRLNMNRVNFTKAASHWMQVINALPSLVDLRLISCGLNFISDPSSAEIIFPAISNITKLRYIDISANYLNSTIPDWLYSCKDLEFVSMGDNSLQGSISNAIGNLTSLTTLDLSHNQLSGNLPMSLGRLSNLEGLDIEDNKMTGVVDESHFANLTKLTSFVASGNHLSLKLSSNWSPPFKLKNLNLASWNLGAGSDIPSWLETQKSTMDVLDLSNTGISGDVPTWFWKMKFLNLSHNHLSGNIPDIGLTGVYFIYLNSNQFSGPLPRVGNTVADINLSNNSFSGDISHFLCDLQANEISGLMFLNLEGNQLTGEIPNCWMKYHFLKVLNLGDNNFSGSIPDSIGTPSLSSLNLRNNKLSGHIPVSISNCTELVKMDLSGNDLKGNIPSWIGTSLTNLMILILRSNKLRGTIPWSICLLNSLQIFELSNNAFSGRIPPCLNNLTAMTIKRVNMRIGGIAMSIFSFISEIHYESASVTTKGKETHYDTFLSLVNVIDLSDNDLSGGIPEELTSLVELKSLSLAGNRLTGPIPKSIGDLKQLESLDLSRNALSGEMPNSFSAMSFLSYLNLSRNNLRGRIPKNTQFDGMDASSFAGNDLCGPPLTRKCHGDDDDDDDDDDDVVVAGNKEDNNDDKAEVEWLYVVLSLGYAVGFSVCCTTLVLKKAWRMAYFGLVDRIWDKLYVYYHIKCTKLWRPRTQSS